MPKISIGYLICEKSKERRQGTDIFLIEGKYYIATCIAQDLNDYRKSSNRFNIKIAKIKYVPGNFTNKSDYEFLGWVDINGALVG